MRLISRQEAVDKVNKLIAKVSRVEGGRFQNISTEIFTADSGAEVQGAFSGKRKQLEGLRTQLKTFSDNYTALQDYQRRDTQAEFDELQALCFPAVRRSFELEQLVEVINRSGERGGKAEQLYAELVKREDLVDEQHSLGSVANDESRFLKLMGDSVGLSRIGFPICSIGSVEFNPWQAAQHLFRQEVKDILHAECQKPQPNFEVIEACFRADEQAFSLLGTLNQCLRDPEEVDGDPFTVSMNAIEAFEQNSRVNKPVLQTFAKAAAAFVIAAVVAAVTAVVFAAVTGTVSSVATPVGGVIGAALGFLKGALVGWTVGKVAAAAVVGAGAGAAAGCGLFRNQGLDASVAKLAKAAREAAPEKPAESGVAREMLDMAGEDDSFGPEHHW